MTPQELRDRTDRFSVALITFCRGKMPCDVLLMRLLTQLQDSGTSMTSNYHAACRAQSRAQFVAKLSIAVEEADECVGWLQKLAAAKLERRPPNWRRSSKRPRNCWPYSPLHARRPVDAAVPELDLDEPRTLITNHQSPIAVD